MFLQSILSSLTQFVSTLPDSVIWFGRVVLAMICGGVIGLERDKRHKEAGIRTHMIVCLTAALMMIISKHGFDDLAGNPFYSSIDPAKVASGIVTGIGFLGAGMIFVRNQSISGLTTAAGIWATAGIGMAIGAGMDELGVLVTLLIVFIQGVLVRFGSWLGIPELETIGLRIKNGREKFPDIEKILEAHGVKIVRFEIQRVGRDNDLDILLFVEFPVRFEIEALMRELTECDAVLSVRI